MKDSEHLYQHKHVEDETKSHSVKMKDLEALRHNAIDEGLKPCYIIQHKGRSWFLVSEEEFMEWR